MQPEARFAPLLIVGVLGIVPTQLSSMLAQILRNQFRPMPYAVSTVLIMAMNVTLGITLAVVLELGVFGIVLGTLIGQTIGCLMRIPLVRASLGRPLQWASLPPLLRFGVAYVPTSLAVWGFTGVDRLIIGALGTRDEVGEYGLAAMLIGPFTVLTLSVGQAWIPRITAIHAVDPAKAKVVISSAIEVGPDFTRNGSDFARRAGTLADRPRRWCGVRRTALQPYHSLLSRQPSPGPSLHGDRTDSRQADGSALCSYYQ